MSTIGEGNGADHSHRLRLLGLGANLVAVCVGWPMLFSGAPTGAQWAGLLATAALLGAGLGALPPATGSPPPRRAAPLLLIAVPLSVGACMLTQPERVHLEAFGVFGTLVAGASLLAYASAVLAALVDSAAALPTTARPTRRQPWDTPPEAEPALQRPLMGLGLVGAVAIAVVAPLWGGLERYAQYWGEAAAEGATLTATVAIALGAAVLSIFVGGAVRTRRGAEPPPSRGRFVSLLAAAALGFAVYFITQPHP